MKFIQFQVLQNIYEKNYDKYRIASETGESSENVEWEYHNCVLNGYVDENGNITKAGLKVLEPYKVDNAVIMAAGLSSRCLPLSQILPKGLFLVKGEILIEREIQQLQSVGIQEIVVVTGYMAEKFEYLKEKYNVILIENTEYKERNNTSSLYAARKYLKNSYICCADNYYKDNIFHAYVYDTYYTCKYTEDYLDEFCITKSEGRYIKEIRRGGKNCYYTMGTVFFSNAFSNKFIDLLVKEYNNDDVKGMLIDTFHLVHINELPSMYFAYAEEQIKEFDTLKEFSDFDPDFSLFFNETMEKELFQRYKNIVRYSGVPTDWITGRLHYNENLWGPSTNCLNALYKTRMEELYLYDSTEEDDLVVALEKKTGISRQNLFLHNGSAEIIKSLFSVMLNAGDTVLLPTPGWSYYAGVVEYKFGKAIYYDMIEEKNKCRHDVKDILSKAAEYNPKIIVITSPAMPTGNAISAEDLEYIIKSCPGSLVVVDEAYYGFTSYDINVKKIISEYDNAVFSRTFSKYYGLANLRIGYGICSSEAMHALWLDLPLHRIPHVSKRMAIAALDDEEYYKEISNETIFVREWFRNQLNCLPNIWAYESDSNFVYIRLSGYDVEAIQTYMKDNGYLIRIFDSHGKQHLRITIAPKEIMEDCFNKLKVALENSRTY